jgi:ubiquinone/menaquinone biosynthesis C-methylase UbiE
MQESLGQNQTVWTDEWKKHSIESEIQMWDFYGLRPWIMKYVPRYGKVVEAGCGLGRIVFLLKKFGINIEGLDFSKETIQLLNTWKSENKIDGQFKVGDITELPYGVNSLNGYLSFGVIEHFIEGPQKPLAEAFRVLKPGGIAIITTPSKSWLYYYNKLRYILRTLIKKIIGRKVNKTAFFQYWYSPKQLKQFIENSGLEVTQYSAADILYTFYEFCSHKKAKIETHKWLFPFAQKLEKTFVKQWGAQTVVIAIKPAEKMHCFFCDEKSADLDCLVNFSVPICEKCSHSSIANRYLKNSKTRFHNEYIINKNILSVEKRECEFCGSDYKTDALFEVFGFNKNVCSKCLKQKDVNIILSNENIQPVWRMR